MTADTNEPTVELDDYTTEYLLLQAKRKELERLTAEYDRLVADFRARIGKAHTATIDGREVFTNRPIRAFQGKAFAGDHPILAKTYTNMVEKPVLDLEGLQRDHPALYAEYQSRQFRIVDVE
jgi:hypothetical protein